MLFNRKSKSKIFCIGFNKTGTTSMAKALTDLGYQMGNQRKAESEAIFEEWLKRDFNKLGEYCKSADAFQDVPFSFLYTFIYLDQKFKGSKFILTKRDSADEWYNSLVKFHGKLWANGRIPNKEDLLKAFYVHKKPVYYGIKQIYNTPDDDLYNKKILTDLYNKHNAMVEDYFKFRPNDLLVLNVKEEGAYKKLCDFIEKKPVYLDFPWENKTDDIKND